MHNPLPNKFDINATFAHHKFDEILEFFKPAFASPESLKIVVRVEGAINGSDFKWNNMSGKFKLAVVRDKQEIASLIGCQIDCFTGNCGVKSIDHLYVFHHTKVPSTTDEYLTKGKELLRILESFLYHRTNCGILVGSDTANHGSTITQIRRFGEGYEFTKPTWNPNYTWAKSHNISLFHKDLNAAKHESYWGESNDRG